MLSIDALGWLHAALGDPAVQLVPAHASRMGPGFRAPAPLSLVHHTTDVATPAAKSAQHWQAPATTANASAHVIVGRDGVVYQCVPLTRIAWHCRGGGMVAGKQVESVNASTIGIEMENIGGLKRVMGADQKPSFYGWPYWRKDSGGNARQSLGPDPSLKLEDGRGAQAELVGGHWCDGFTAVQLEACGKLLGCLAHRFGWAREFCGMGHVDYDPVRKEDPWPLFRAKHLPRILDLAFPPAQGIG